MVHIRVSFVLIMLIRVNWGGNVHTVKENAQDLLFVNKENRLKVNADKSKYIVMSPDQNASRSHGMKIDNSLFGRVYHSKNLRKTVMNKNSFQEQIKSRLKSGNVCVHWVRIGC